MNKKIADKIVEEYIAFRETLCEDDKINCFEQMELFKLYLEAKK